MPQSVLQRITTNWHWVKYFRMQPIRTDYCLRNILPFLSPRTIDKIAVANLYIARARNAIEDDIAAAKKKIREQAAKDKLLVTEKSPLDTKKGP